MLRRWRRRALPLLALAATMLGPSMAVQASELAPMVVSLGDGPNLPLIDDPNLPLIDVQGELAVDGRRQPYRLLAPRQGQSLPIVLFSHGAYALKDGYDVILRPWARAGFIVIAPTHADSVSIGTARGSQNPQFFAWRLADMEALIGDLERILTHAGLTGRANTSRLAATGHSFGGLVAQTLAGASYRDTTNNEPVFRQESRVVGAVIISGAGLMPGLVGTEDLSRLQLPLLITVGSDDLAQMPGLSGYSWRREIFDYAGSRQKLLLVQEGADHYLGGQVGRDDLPRSPYADDYLHDFLWLSILHLRSWLTDDTAASHALAELSRGTADTALRRSRIEAPAAKPRPD